MVKRKHRGPLTIRAMSAPPPSASPSRCRLLELPGELRNRIYRFVVVQDRPILIISGILQEPISHSKKVGRRTVTWETGNLMFHSDPPPQQPELASTCKHIRSEVLSLWYAENTFKIGHYGSTYSAISLRRFLRWRKMIGNNAVHIRSLELAFEHEAYLGYTRTFYVSARIDKTGELCADIVLDGKSAIQGYSMPQSYYMRCCPCHLKTVWRKSKRQGRSGARLMELMRTYMVEHTGSRTEVACKTCGLEIETHALI